MSAKENMLAENLFINWRLISRVGSEVTPFVFKDRLYRLENFKRSEDFPDKSIGYRFHEDGFRIRDLSEDRIVSVPLLNHYFATAFVWKGQVNVFCGDYELNRPWWHIRRIVHLASDDLLSWTSPKVVLEADKNENLFNNSVCWDGQRFVMLYETDDPRWPKFTFKFAESFDLKRWHQIPQALYGWDKYVGGPAIYYDCGWYYVLYVHELDNKWEIRLARSRDLIKWEEAFRPFLTPNHERLTNPDDFPGVYEVNASDADLCEWNGKTLIYWNGGDQYTCGDLQMVEFQGSRSELFESFFVNEIEINNEQSLRMEKLTVKSK